MGLTDSDGNHHLVDPDGKEEGGGHHSDAIQQLVLYLLLILDLRGWDCAGGVYTAVAFRSLLCDSYGRYLAGCTDPLGSTAWVGLCGVHCIYCSGIQEPFMRQLWKVSGRLY